MQSNQDRPLVIRRQEYRQEIRRRNIEEQFSKKRYQMLATECIELEAGNDHKVELIEDMAVKVEGWMPLVQKVMTLDPSLELFEYFSGLNACQLPQVFAEIAQETLKEQLSSSKQQTTFNPQNFLKAHSDELQNLFKGIISWWVHNKQFVKKINSLAIRIRFIETPPTDLLLRYFPTMVNVLLLFDRLGAALEIDPHSWPGESMRASITTMADVIMNMLNADDQLLVPHLAQIVLHIGYNFELSQCYYNLFLTKQKPKELCLLAFTYYVTLMDVNRDELAANMDLMMDVLKNGIQVGPSFKQDPKFIDVVERLALLLNQVFMGYNMKIDNLSLVDIGRDRYNRQQRFIIKTLKFFCLLSQKGGEQALRVITSQHYLSVFISMQMYLAQGDINLEVLQICIKLVMKMAGDYHCMNYLINQNLRMVFRLTMTLDGFMKINYSLENAAFCDLYVTFLRLVCGLMAHRHFLIGFDQASIIGKVIQCFFKTPDESCSLRQIRREYAYLYITCLSNMSRDSQKSGLRQQLPTFLLETDKAYQMLLEVIRWPYLNELCQTGLKILVQGIKAANEEQYFQFLTCRELVDALLELIEEGNQKLASQAESVLEMVNQGKRELGINVQPLI